MGTITVAIPFTGKSHFPSTLRQFTESPLVEKVYVVHDGGYKGGDMKCEGILSSSFTNGRTVGQILANTVTDHLLIVTRSDAIELGQGALERFVTIATETSAGMVYSDYQEISDGKRTGHPLLDYQFGSVRDNFDFGFLLFLSCKPVRYAVTKYGAPADVRWAGLYDLRLKISIDAGIFHLQEFLYSTPAYDERTSGEKLFDYVDPRNRDVQKEMEVVFTQFLKDAGAYLAPGFNHVPASREPFPVEASVVIPVRNRERTIGDAVESALGQKTDFAFNVIVVENHSTDATGNVIGRMHNKDKRVVCLVPERRDLGIGGCWNEAVFSDHCGRFAVQLDSDDLYSSNGTLQRVVDEFRSNDYGMVIGSYKLVNFELQEIPPGIIDHREWTDDNGRNNALRVNGLGAPRAFRTEVAREIRFPNVSYGEDYAVALAVSRKYRIGRIY
ncbi:MAG TPA: glycosyltransferase family A protein, partial [Bacteroidota bacterium]